MENNQLTTELIALEKKYWRAMQDHDLKTALELTDFPCLVTGSQGANLVDKETYTEMFESHKGSTMKVKFMNEPTVRLLNENIAAIAYEVHSDMKANGKEESLDAVDSSTWIRKNGTWRCAFHTETPLRRG